MLPLGVSDSRLSVFQPAAFQVFVELALHIARKLPTLRR